MTPSSYVIETLLLIGQASTFFMGPMPPCGSNCSYDESDLRLSCTGLALACIPKPCCVERTRFVDLSVNNLTTIGPIAFQSFPHLHSLDVRLNSIESLSRWAFQGLRYLQILDLRENKLTLLRSGIFEGLLNLKTLILTKNRISDIQPGTFRLLPNLKTLRLNHNVLQVVYPDTFAQLTELVTLDLSANNIHTVYYGSFHTLANLEFLSLANNKLASLPEFLDSLEELDHLNLKGNPLFCDCSLEFVRLWFRERDSSYKKSGICSQPEVLKDRILASVDTQLLCESFDESMYGSLSNSVEDTTARVENLSNPVFEQSTTEATHLGMTSDRPLTNSVIHKQDAPSTTHVTIKLHTVYEDANENALNLTSADGGHGVDLTQSHKDFQTTKGTVNLRTQDINPVSSHTTLKTNTPTSRNRENTFIESTVTNSPINVKTKLFYEKLLQFTQESHKRTREPSDSTKLGTRNHSGEIDSTTPEPELSQDRPTDNTFLSADTIERTDINGQKIATIKNPLIDHEPNMDEDSDSTTQFGTVSKLGLSQDMYNYDSNELIQSSYYTPDSDLISSSSSPSSSVMLHLKAEADASVPGYSKLVNETKFKKHGTKQFLNDRDLTTSSQTINSSLLAGDSTFQSLAIPEDPSANMTAIANAPLRGYLETVTESPSFEESPLTTSTTDLSYTDSFTTLDHVLNKDTLITSLENDSFEADMVQFIMMGESVDLECPLPHLAPVHQYFSSYRIKWLSPLGQWVDHSINRFTVSRHGSLTIADVVPSDNGMYRCVRVQYMSDPSVASVELRVSCPCRKIPEMRYTTDESTTKQTTLETPMTSSLRKLAYPAVPEGNEAHTEQKYCNRVPVAVAVLITFQATMALCILTFCAYLSWRSSRDRRTTNRPEPYLERTQTVSEVNYYDSGEPPNRTSRVPTIVYESTGDEEVVEENNVADSSESDSALSMSGSHRNSAIDSEYVNAQTLTRDRSSTYADLDPHSRSRHDTYSSLHREDD